jgi:hypothetical protein
MPCRDSITVHHISNDQGAQTFESATSISASAIHYQKSASQSSSNCTRGLEEEPDSGKDDTCKEGDVRKAGLVEAGAPACMSSMARVARLL